MTIKKVVLAKPRGFCAGVVRAIDIVERALAHVGHQSGVAGVYNKAEYLEERRRALSRWADLVQAIVTGEKSGAVVVPLRG